MMQGEGAGKKFLESDCDYLLFLDSDMMPTADTLNTANRA